MTAPTVTDRDREAARYLWDALHFDKKEFCFPERAIAQAIAVARAEEREACVAIADAQDRHCAKTFSEHHLDEGFRAYGLGQIIAQTIANAIRARGSANEGDAK